MQSGRLAGAGLDVFEQEPLPDDSPLWDLDNVIVCPHISGLTEHYDDRVIDTFVANLQEYMAGKPPSLHRVDLTRQY